MQRTSSDTWWRIMSAMLGFIETSLAGSPMRVLLRERTGFRIGPNIKRPRSGRVLKVRRSHGGAELFRVARLWRWSRTLTCRLEAKLHCHVWVPTEASPPEPVGQHHDPVLSLVFLLARKGATEGWLHPQHLEERRGDMDPTHLFGGGVSPVVSGDREEPVPPCHHIVERATLITPIDKVAWRHAHAVVHVEAQFVVDVVDPVQTFRPIERRWPEEETIDNGEDGGVSPDPQRQREHCHRRKAGVSAQRAEHVRGILTRLVQPDRHPHSPRVLLCQGDIAEREHGLSLRFCRRHPTLNVLLRLSLDMVPELSLKSIQRMEPLPHAGLSTRVMARVSFCHFVVSTTNCFRPFGVRR